MTRRGLFRIGAGLGASILVGRQLEAQGRKDLAERLGHPKGTRLLMIHADDLGMCHSVNVASRRAMTEGVVSSASVMVPCPWFPEMAQWSRENPKLDLGLHLTLTSEWRTYRWRPVTPINEVPGLIDPEGFMWRSVEDVVKHAKPEEVEKEIRAQIARALQFGMKPTHVDSHMGTLFSHPKFFEVYIRVAQETGFMPMIPGPTPEILKEAAGLGLDYAALTRKLEGDGMVVLDLLNTSLQGPTYEGRKTAFETFVKGLTPGVTELICHLAGDEDEIQHVTGNWRNRFNEFKLFTEPSSRKLLEDNGVKLVGYRELGALWKRK